MDDAFRKSNSESEILDSRAVAQLKAISGTEGTSLFVELVELFLRDLPTRVDMLQDAADKKDIEAMLRLTHLLKGSSGSIGAKALTEQCKSLELQLREFVLSDAMASLDALKVEVTRTMARLKAEL
jgi:HPt (histidine-containing phosphotransfer) domain-containing protein